MTPTELDPSTLLGIMGEWLRETAPGVVEDVGDRPRLNLAVVCLGIGLQFGLELSQLDRGVARELIRALHESQPDGTAEHNRSALIFLDLVEQRH